MKNLKQILWMGPFYLVITLSVVHNQHQHQIDKNSSPGRLASITCNGKLEIIFHSWIATKLNYRGHCKSVMMDTSSMFL